MKLTAKKVKDYMSYRSSEGIRHCPEAIAAACNDMYEEFKHDEFTSVKPLDLLRLLFFNDPIPSLHTHSYSFHTAAGRHIIETLKQKYYEYEN
jgi:hypothetical protein